MRVWTWQRSGPEEPPLEDMAKDDEGRPTVWDVNEDQVYRDERGHWHYTAGLDLGYLDVPWSVLIETQGPITSRAKVEAPLP